MNVFPKSSQHVIRRKGTKTQSGRKVLFCNLCRAIGLLVLLCGSPALGQRQLKDIPPPDPEIERRSFQLAEGFEVNLYTSDPQIAKPIHMNFDPQGRLWIAGSESYPHIKPGEPHNDKILVVEDRDGDGVAETTSVFADGLLIPTGLEPGDGGVYVANSTELIHLQDTDGDGKADRRRTVLSGFGTEDTHHLLHTLRWGPDGWLYMNQSIYIHSHIETPYGVKRLNGGGIWRFHPRTYELEVFARGWVNAWGHAFDAYGQSFVTDGAGGEGINYVVPGGAYPTAVGAARILHGLNPGSPKYCGLEIVSGRHFPDDWQGNLITNDFRGNRVVRFALKEDGSSFAAQQMPDLIRSDHVAFRPIDVKMGPDGALYIADWYNPIIQHGEVDFRDPRRDRVHGRIWRVTAKGRPLVPRPKFAGAAVEELVAHLGAPEDWTRQQAKRALLEHPAEKVAAAVLQRAATLDVLEENSGPEPLELFWALQSQGITSNAAIDMLKGRLRSGDHRIRAAATRVLHDWHDLVPDALGLLGRQVDDEHPRVRLEAVRALAEIRDPRSVEVALRALDRPVDPFLDYALWLTVRDLQPVWLEEFQAGRLTFGGNTSHATFALKAVGSPAVVPALLQQLRAEGIGNREAAEVLDLIAALGRPPELRTIFNLALSESVPRERRIDMLQSLAAAGEKRSVRPDGDLAEIARLLESDDVLLQTAAARCIGAWKLISAGDPLAAFVRKRAELGQLHAAHLDALSAISGQQAASALSSLLVKDLPAEQRMLIVAGLSRVELSAAAAEAAELLSTLDPAAADASVLWSAFLQQKRGPDVLAAALHGRRIPADAAKVGLRILAAAGREERALEAALRAAGGITGEAKPLTPQELEQLIADVNAHGDPRRGELVFRRSELGCLKCHAVGGAGGRVGPDLLSLGAAAQVDYLIESLLEPNKKVKENYHTLVVATGDGRVLTGVKVRETEESLILRDADDREINIPLDNIEEHVPGSSMMPAGLTEKITRAELVDLVRFLSALGKADGFRIGPQMIARRWEVMQPTEDAAFRLRRTRYATAAEDDPAYAWQSAYATVAGELPLSDVPILKVRSRGPEGVGFSRCEFDVTTAGAFTFHLNSAAGLQLWIDADPVEVSEEMTIDLDRGRWRFTFAVDPAARAEPLRLEWSGAAETTAQGRFVSGK